MLNRNDLAKQFELVVQQEIINHNKQMLETNISINSLRENINENMAKQDEINAKFASEISKFSGFVVDSSNHILRLVKVLESFINDSKDVNEKLNEKVNVALENSLQAHRKHEHNVNAIDDLCNRVDKLEDALLANSLHVSREINDAKLALRSDIDKSKKEILSIPSESQAIKKELESKIEALRIDREGLLQELQIYKKKAFITDKLIEDLYTQIERLKAGGLCHKQD